MKKEQDEVVTDEEIEKAFAFSYNGYNHRDVLSQGVLKESCGFVCGGTITQIMLEMGLFKGERGDRGELKITKKGKRFLFDSFKTEN